MKTNKELRKFTPENELKVLTALRLHGVSIPGYWTKVDKAPDGKLVLKFAPYDTLSDTAKVAYWPELLAYARECNAISYAEE